MLARVVLVDWTGRPLLDRFVKPTQPVEDYRTSISGVTPADLNSPHAMEFKSAQAAVSSLVSGRVLVGHGLVNDLKACRLSHPFHATRDTATVRGLSRPSRDGRIRPFKLSHLVAKHLGITIQVGEHEPEEDAQAAMALFKLWRHEWRDIAGGAQPSTSSSNSKKRRRGREEEDAAPTAAAGDDAAGGGVVVAAAGGVRVKESGRQRWMRRKRG